MDQGSEKTIDLSFVSDDKLRQMVERDDWELQQCLQHELWKSAIVLAGSLVEAVLVDYFLTISTTKRLPQQVLKADLATLTEWAESEALISPQTKQLSTVLRHYRNLIHPGRERREEQDCDGETAQVANILLGKIAGAIGDEYATRRGPTAEQVLSKLKTDPAFAEVFEHTVDKMLPIDRVRLFRAIPAELLRGNPTVAVVKTLVRSHDSLKRHVPSYEKQTQIESAYDCIESSSRQDAVLYLSLFVSDLNLLSVDKADAVIRYLLGTLDACEANERKAYVHLGLFRSLAEHLATYRGFSPLTDFILRRARSGATYLPDAAPRGVLVDALKSVEPKQVQSIIDQLEQDGSPEAKRWVRVLRYDVLGQPRPGWPRGDAGTGTPAIGLGR